MKVISICIPVYNEETTIDQILIAVSKQRLVTEIVIIDDCSKDNSVDKIQSAIDRLKKKRKDLIINFVQNKTNQGKGSSLRKGFFVEKNVCNV